MNESLHDLQTIGVAMVPYAPELQQKVDDAADFWHAFRRLPLEEKLQLRANDDGAGTGYEYKTAIGDHADYKENFDVALAHRDYLETALASIDPSSMVARFAHAALELAGVMHPLAMAFATKADTELELPGFADIVKASHDTSFVRFLHYPCGRTAGDIIAEPHTDQSGFTFHLYETDSGCQRLDYATRQWIDMPVEKDHAAVFAAMQLQQFSQGKLRALAHRVIATTSTSAHGRDAVVCFNQLADQPVYNKSLYGRLQEYVPGFNYDTSPKEFDQLFTPSV